MMGNVYMGVFSSGGHGVCGWLTLFCFEAFKFSCDRYLGTARVSLSLLHIHTLLPPLDEVWCVDVFFFGEGSNSTFGEKIGYGGIGSEVVFSRGSECA